MKQRCLVLFSVLAAVVVLAAVRTSGQVRRSADSTAASTKSWTQPRTAWGDPDLQGFWRGGGGVPLERSEKYTGREFLTDEEVAARVKAAEEGQALRVAGKVYSRGFRAQENYNIVFNTSDEKPRINRRTSAIIDPPDGRLPAWTLAQVKLWEEREAATAGRGESDSVQDVNSGARCFPDLGLAKVGFWGLGFGGAEVLAEGEDAMGRIVNGGNSRILQAPGFVVISREEAGEYFIIPLDRRPTPGPKIQQLQGVTRGHWDGNTLVVEHTNINYDNIYLIIPNASFPLYPGTGKTLKVTERYTRTGPDTMEYRYTVTDPAVYTRPYTVSFDLNRDDNYKISPDLCHENNRDLAGMLGNARGDDVASLQIGAQSVEMRRARFELLKTEAQEAAKKQSPQTQSR